LSAALCAKCGQATTTTSAGCSAANCSGVAASCPACKGVLTCTVCEHPFCQTHLTNCAQCKGNTCAYCARQMAGQSSVLDLNCFDKFTSKMIETDVIATCPLASTLPPPDESIFNDFDPPIELLSYSQSRAAGGKGVRPPNVQAEHFIPNSCFIAGTGRSGATVHGAGKYSEGKALTYWVEDDQIAGTEHKYLTDRERAFCNEVEKKGQYPTLGQWFDFMQAVTAESITMHRTYTGDVSNLTQPQIENKQVLVAQQAAYAIRYKIQAHFENNLKASTSTFLANGIVGGAAPPKIVTKSQIYDDI
jgi:hypothetical protein